MYFTKVELHNFGIYKGTHEMCLVNKSGNKNITLIGGLNGRGKTTFHDAVLLALYGKQAVKYVQEKVRSYEKLLVDHINKHAMGDETYIAVSICLDDGTALRIKRLWRLKNNRLEHKISVEKNGKIDKYLGENWNYYIEEILPFGIARFFFFNNEKITQLADDVSFEQIKSSIKSAIGVSTIEGTIEHIDEIIRRTKNALKAFEESEVNVEYKNIDEEIKNTEKNIKESACCISEIEYKHELLTAKLEVKEQEFWANGGNLNLNRDKIIQEMEDVKAEVKKVEEEIHRIASDAATPLYLCKNLVVESYDSEIAYQKEEAKYYSDKIIFELNQQIMEKLSKCGLDALSFDKVEKIVNEVLICNQKAKFFDQNRKSISPTSVVLYKHLMTSAFQFVAQQIKSLINKINEQENELLNLDAHLDKTDEKTLAMQLFDALKSLESQKTIIEENHKQQKNYHENLKNKLEILKKQRTKLIKQIAEKQNNNDDNARIVKYAAMSSEVLNEFKVRLQQEKILKLSSTITNCFKGLVEKDSLVSKIKIEPQSLDISILDIDGKELLKTQLSAGEQQMFAVAVVWALALTSGYKAPVIIDTPMARLDSSHRVNFVTKYLPAASSQVVVLSTDEEITGRYLDLISDNIISAYTLLYKESEQCTSVVSGYFGKEYLNDC